MNFVNSLGKGLFSALTVSIGSIACATYELMYASAHSCKTPFFKGGKGDFILLAGTKNISFPI
jgi:hypothetical protein